MGYVLTAQCLVDARNLLEPQVPVQPVAEHVGVSLCPLAVVTLPPLTSWESGPLGLLTPKDQSVT